MEKFEIDSVKSNKEIVNKNKSIEITLFLSLWDEELGVEIVEYCPKSFIGNLESLTHKIFSAFQFFFKDLTEQFKFRKLILPVVDINRKAYVMLDVIINPDVRGGKQPFIVVLLVPDYFSEERLEVFDKILLKIARKYINEQEILIKGSFKEIEDIFIEEHKSKEPVLEIEEEYSYTAAIDDFKAGVKLYQTKNFDEAIPALSKALMKFEHDNQKNLTVEVLYLLGSLFAQKKDFNIAEDYFLQLEIIAEELNHQKYKEISTFMSGFCSYKNDRAIKALTQFSKIELFKKNFINEFQYYTIYGKALENVQNYEEAIKKFSFALRIIEKKDMSILNRQQLAQTKYILGTLYYKQVIPTIRQFGINKQESYKEMLYEAIKLFESSGEIWRELGEKNQLINTFRLIGDIYEFLGEDSKFFEFYNKAIEWAEKSQNISSQFLTLKRVIQKQAFLGFYEENIEKIRTILEKFENYVLFDLYTKSIFHKQLGISLINTNRLDEGLSELIQAYEILEKFKNPVDEQLEILNRIINIYTKTGDNEDIAYYSKKLNKIVSRLEQRRSVLTQKGKLLDSLKDVWFFVKSIGCEIYSYSPEIGVETDLLGGFLTALQALSQEITYKSFDSIIYGDDRFTIYQEEDRDFYIVARSNIKISEESIINILSIIYNRFWKEYYNEIIGFGGNIDPFKSFTKIFESFDWTLLSKEEKQKLSGLRLKITETREDIKKLVRE
jgi:tetratricopeptide (TPR) repeat protein